MAGKLKQQMYEYDVNYVLFKKHDSKTSVCIDYYNGAKYPLYNRHEKIHELPNGHIVLKEALGKLNETWVKKEIRKMNDIFKIDGNKGGSSGPIEVLNESGEVIAWFAKAAFIDKISEVASKNDASNQINNASSRNMPSKNGLYYRRA